MSAYITFAFTVFYQFLNASRLIILLILNTYRDAIPLIVILREQNKHIPLLSLCSPKGVQQRLTAKELSCLHDVVNSQSVFLLLKKVIAPWFMQWGFCCIVTITVAASATLFHCFTFTIMKAERLVTTEEKTVLFTFASIVPSFCGSEQLGKFISNFATKCTTRIKYYYYYGAA